MKKFVILTLILACIGLVIGTSQATDVKILAHDEIQSTVSQGRVVVDFYADWCAACRQFMPIYMEVAKEMGGELTFAKVKLEQGDTPWKEFNINTIPAVILFENGKEVKRHGSFSNAASFKAFLKN